MGRRSSIAERIVGSEGFGFQRILRIRHRVFECEREYVLLKSPRLFPQLFLSGASAPQEASRTGTRKSAGVSDTMSETPGKRGLR